MAETHMRLRRHPGPACYGRVLIDRPLSTAAEPSFNYHTCEFGPQHWGVHLCWCGLAFNDAGEMLYAKALQRHLGEP